MKCIENVIYLPQSHSIQLQYILFNTHFILQLNDLISCDFIIYAFQIKRIIRLLHTLLLFFVKILILNFILFSFRFISIILFDYTFVSQFVMYILKIEMCSHLSKLESDRKRKREANNCEAHRIWVLLIKSMYNSMYFEFRLFVH